MADASHYVIRGGLEGLERRRVAPSGTVTGVPVVAVVQPVALQGEAKLLNPLTMENIAGAVLEDGVC